MGETRRRDATATRAAILDAARARFGADGFDRVTLREVAASVGVDPAMVIRYFRSKEGLFAEAATFDLDLPDLTGVDPADLGDVLIPRFIAAWEGDAAFLSLLRAAASSEAAAAKMLDVFAGQVAPALAAVAVDRVAERAALVGSQVLGLAFARYVLRLPPLAGMSPEGLRAWISPVLRHYLTGEPPTGEIP